MIQVEFYGACGSIPSPASSPDITSKLKALLSLATPSDLESPDSIDHFLKNQDPTLAGTIGGNTSCVRFHVPDSPVIICDAGSGLRNLGNHLLEFEPESKEICLFMSHTHWDHMMGFPFFAPAYIPGYHIKIYGCHEELKKRFEYQQTLSHFPVELSQMSANIEFVQLTAGETVSFKNFNVTPHKMDHPGDSYAYIFEREEKKYIYSTDAAYQVFQNLETENNIFSHAELFIFDAMYSFSDYMDKFDWGHCSSLVGVDIAVREKVKKLILFHHEPQYDDAKLNSLWLKTREYLQSTYPDSSLEISLAIEGNTI